MSRLTELLDIDGMKIKTAKERPLSNQGLGDILCKLYNIEDIEDDLGCPLDVVFKAARNGFWYVSDKFWKNVFTKQFSNRPILFYHYEYECFCFEVGVSGVYIPFKDYKKTWWLKEDLSE